MINIRRCFTISLFSLVLLWSFCYLLPYATSSLLVFLLEQKGEISISYLKKENSSFTKVTFDQLTIKKEGFTEINVGKASVQYNVLELLAGQISLSIYARNILLEAKSIFNNSPVDLEQLQFDDLDTTVLFSPDKKINFKYLRLSGDMGDIFLAGSMQQKKNLDLYFSLFVQDDFLKVLPNFISENLFNDNLSTKKQISFSLNGNWFSPSINFQSDLIKINFTSHAA